MSPSVRFGVLGTLAVWRDGELVTLRSPTHRALLGVLLLAEGSLTPERIVALVGADDVPKNARQWVQVAVSRLRTWLAEYTGGAVTIQFSGTGYRLVAPPDAVDLGQFRALLAAAEVAGSAAERMELLADGLALWRGPVLSDARGGLRDSSIAAAIEQLRPDTACALAEAAIACARPERALPVLGELVLDHPLDERLNAWWALALAGCGRQADALAAIEAAKTRLADELGVDPGEHLRNAQLRVLRQHVLPSAAEAARPAAPERLWRGPRGQITTVIGRDTQERELTALLAGRRLVTVTGPGGCGKTTVALHLAEQIAAEYPDGVAVLVLTPFTTADEILMALGSLMDVTGATAEQVRHTLALALRSRRLLLVMDNCEHVIASSAELVRWLLAAAPGVTVLATSRQPLQVTEEVAWALGPLAVPDVNDPEDPGTPAVALFLRRAKESLPSFTLGEGDLGRIAHLCRRLDGLPLALELAAARVRALTVRQIVDRLDLGFGLLDGAGGGREERHHTLRSTLGWSYDLLDDAERRLLARLSVFRGGCTVEVAEAVCSVAPLTVDQVLPTLVALVDKSLVQPYDVDGARRFRLLETVAEFAAERLEPGEAAAVADRHVDYWLGRARVIDSWPGYNDRAQECRGLAADIGNVRAAINHGYSVGRIADTSELSVRLLLLWVVNGAYIGEAEQLLRRPAEVAGPELTGCSAESRTFITCWHAILLGLHEDYIGARDEMRLVLPDLARYRPREYRLSRISVGTFSRFMLDPAALEECPAMMADVGDDERHDEPSTALTAAGTIYAWWGHFDEAARTTDVYAARAARRGTPFSVSQHVVRIEVALGLGDLAEARRQETILRDRLDAIDDPAEREPARRAIATYNLAIGRPEEARDFLARAIADLRRSLPPSMARDSHLMLLLGEAQRRTGDPAGAAQSLLQSLSRALAGSRFQSGFTAVLPTAMLAADMGDHAAARDLADRWDTIRRKLGFPVPQGFQDAAAETFGLDPAGVPLSQDENRWDPRELRALVERAQRWCARADAGSLIGRHQQT